MGFIVLVVILMGSCTLSEAIVEKYMKLSEDPCKNFHQYACGKWSDVNANLDNGDALSLLDMAINEKIKILLESEQEKDIFVKLNAFYKSCRNLKTYNLRYFLDSVKPKSGWVAMNSSWKKEEFSWIDTIGELRKYAAQIILEFTVIPKWDNTSVNIISLDLVKVHPSSKATFLDILYKTSIDNPAADIIADELIEFEEELAKIVPKSNISPENDDSVEVVLGYLSESLPQVNLTKYFKTVFGQDLDPMTPMIVQNVDSMGRLSSFLDDTDPKIICNYIMIKFIEFLNVYSIDDTSPNECIKALHKAMPLAVDHLIETNFYDHEYDQIVHDLFNYLKVEFLASVTKLYEKQRDVLSFVYSKVSVMEIQIGNTKRNLTSDEVSTYYKDLVLNKENFYTNLLSSFKYKTDKNLASLNGLPINIAYQWVVTPSPFFMQPKNKIVVPLSLLQESLLGKESAEKYSVLGFSIAHEFLHGFDVNGVYYDYKGTSVESAVSSHPIFAEQVKCVENHLQSKGIGETIADLGGIRLAFKAFQRSLMQIGKDVEESDESKRSFGQIFFIDFAQFFCGISKKEVKSFSGSDVHDKDELRVEQSLMHFDEFSKAFGCPQGSIMNPENKCKIW